MQIQTKQDMEQRAHWEVWHQSKLHDFKDVLAQYTYRCATAAPLHGDEGPAAQSCMSSSASLLLPLHACASGNFTHKAEGCSWLCQVNKAR